MKNILLTCDTEIGELGLLLTNGLNLFIEGKIDGRSVGYDQINKIAKQFNITVEHFVDIYPFQRFGEDKFARICNNILSSGHSLHLHTHPSGFVDPKRKYMSQYTQEEQRRIIEVGINKIFEWTKITPIAHRAGGYGANDTTLDLLNQFGIKYDSSSFYLHDKCGLKSTYINCPWKINNVTEIPITVYRKCHIISATLTKLDYRYGSTIGDIIRVVKSAPDGCVLVLFMHSFNFLNIFFDQRENRITDVKFDITKVKLFETLLSNLTEMPGVKFTTFAKLDTSTLNTTDFLEKTTNVFYFPHTINLIKRSLRKIQV